MLFSDLCVTAPGLQQAQAPAAPAAHLHALIQNCAKLGYGRVAVERRLGGGRAGHVVEADYDAVAGLGHKGMTVLTRLTFAVADIKDCQAITMNNEHVRRFDILACEAKSEKTFQHACMTADIDIITMDFSGRLPFYLKFPPVGVAISRGITFEVRYCDAIRDSTARQNFLSNVVALIRVTKGRNIIVSSGTSDRLGLRGPNDIVNLMVLLGLNRDQAKATVTRNMDVAFDKARARRSVKGVIEMIKT